eukprot:TsM_000098500 transcript=TsM_000098500 gene=TsM_000098500
MFNDTSGLQLPVSSIPMFQKQLRDGTKKAIEYAEVARAQFDESVRFEVSPSAPYKYPGNYTVTAYTNDAVNNTAVHSIIMPHFRALQPPFYELHVSWDSVTAKWGKPQLFQASCTYRVDAFPLEENAVHVMEAPRPNDETVTFRNLTPDAKYEIKLQSNCTDSEPFWTSLGVVETNPGDPGIPTDVQLAQIGPNMVNLTWTPPSELPGKHPYYEWNCGPKRGFARMSGKTNDTYVVLKDLAAGNWSCTVQAVMKTKIYMDKYGAKSSAVELLVDPAGYSETTTSSTTLTTATTSTPTERTTEAASTTTQQPTPPETTESTLSTSTPREKEEVATQKREEATSTTTQRKMCCNLPKLSPSVALDCCSIKFTATLGGSFSKMTETVRMNQH